VADRFKLEQLRRRVEANPASIAFATLAEEYRRAGMLDEAIATCQAGLRRHPSYVSARVTLGTALIEAARYDEARAELETVLRTVPENLAAIRGLAAIDAAERGEAPAPPEGRVETRQVERLDSLLAAIQQARTGSRLGR
jgi:tetratricopeptide (TPR) repeat protein